MIKLLIEVDKKITDLTPAEIKSIAWPQLPLSELENIDANVLKHVKALHRQAYLHQYFDNYNMKDEAFWTEMFKKGSDWYYIYQLLKNSDNPLHILKTHPSIINKLDDNFKLYYNIITPLQFKKQKDLDMPDFCAASPYISDEAWEESGYDLFALADYNPVFVNSKFFKQGREHKVPSDLDLTSNDIGTYMQMLCKHVFDKVQVQVLTWDHAVQFFKENPEQYTPKVEEFISIWWNESL